MFPGSKQAGGASEIARSAACGTTMRVSRTKSLVGFGAKPQAGFGTAVPTSPDSQRKSLSVQLSVRRCRRRRSTAAKARGSLMQREAGKGPGTGPWWGLGQSPKQGLGRQSQRSQPIKRIVFVQLPLRRCRRRRSAAAKAPGGVARSVSLFRPFRPLHGPSDGVFPGSPVRFSVGKTPNICPIRAHFLLKNAPFFAEKNGFRRKNSNIVTFFP